MGEKKWEEMTREEKLRANAIKKYGENYFNNSQSEEKNIDSKHSFANTAIITVSVIAFCLFVGMCQYSSDSNDSKLERDTERLCDAVGGCTD